MVVHATLRAYGTEVGLVCAWDKNLFPGFVVVTPSAWNSNHMYLPGHGCSKTVARTKPGTANYVLNILSLDLEHGGTLPHLCLWDALALGQR